MGRISNLKIQKFVYPRDVSFQPENFVSVFSLVGRKIFSHRLLRAYSLSTRVITHRGNSKTASSSTKLRDLNHSPTVSSSFIPFSHYLLFNRKIKHVNPPRPLPFVFFIGRAQLVWQATTIKRALRERKEPGIVDASVQMLILIPGERTGRDRERDRECRYGMETVKTSSFVRKTADLIFTSAVFTSEAIILGHRIFNFSLISTRENVICRRDSRAVSHCLRRVDCPTPI